MRLPRRFAPRNDKEGRSSQWQIRCALCVKTYSSG